MTFADLQTFVCWKRLCRVRAYDFP